MPDISPRLARADERARTRPTSASKLSFSRAARAYLRVFLAELASDLEPDSVDVHYCAGGPAVRGELVCTATFRRWDLGIFVSLGSFRSPRLDALAAGYWRFTVPSRDRYGAGCDELSRNRPFSYWLEPVNLARAVRELCYDAPKA